MFLFLGGEACGILATLPGMKLAPPTLKGEVSTTGLPGKSPFPVILFSLDSDFRLQSPGKLCFFPLHFVRCNVPLSLKTEQYSLPFC